MKAMSKLIWALPKTRVARPLVAWHGGPSRESFVQAERTCSVNCSYLLQMDLMVGYPEGSNYEGNMVDIDQQVMSLATEWHREFCPATVSPDWLSWNQGCVARIA